MINLRLGIRSVFAVTAMMFLAIPNTFADSNQNERMHSKNALQMMTQDQRDKMAAMHEKMAECMRTTKPMHECREEMMQSCRAFGEKGCPEQRMMMKEAKKTKTRSKTRYHRGVLNEGGGESDTF